MSDGSKVQINIHGTVKNAVGEVKGNFIFNESPPSLREAAAEEIKQILTQIAQSSPNNATSEEIGMAAMRRIQNNPTLSERVISALKAGSTEALAQLINHPAASFVIATLEEWYKHGKL